MKTDGTKAFIKDMPSWAKGVIALIIVILIIVIIYFLYKKLKGKLGEKNLSYTVNDAEDEYSRLKSSGQKLTYPVIAYQQTANGIAIALDGCESIQTELKLIDDITKVVKKPIDWYFLVKTFGVRTIEGCGWGSTTYALPELLKDQLDTGGIYAGLGGGIGTGITTSSNNLLEGYLKKIGIIL